jgi:aryl-alcohol dehydrogenase-like predicted oxidoreductase
VQQQTLGPMTVGSIGLGCMGMSEFYGATDEVESIATIHRALDLRCNLLDTADIYGHGDNEILVGRAIRSWHGRRDQIVVASKFGILRKRDDPGYRGISGQAAYVRQACEASLQRLGLDVIDLYYIHRVDRTIPIEETVGAMADLVRQGKVRALGISECGPQTLRRAHVVHPITAVQSEYSLWTRDVEQSILPLCKELGIAFVPYSPLGRGFLSGEIKSRSDFSADDFRRHMPRFSEANFAGNLRVVAKLNELALAKGVTASQLALAWVLARGREYGLTVLPIPGTKRIRYLEQNIQAAKIVLTQAELSAIADVDVDSVITGNRYGDMQFVNIESA